MSFYVILFTSLLISVVSNVCHIVVLGNMGQQGHGGYAWGERPFCMVKILCVTRNQKGR